MPLDPQAQMLLDKAASAGLPPVFTLPVEQARQRMIAAFVTSDEPEPIAAVENRNIAGPAGDIPIRLYWPEGKGPFPITVFYHGGGWTLNNLDTHDTICRSITRQAECLTVSVDFRLAPEHPFPAVIEDSYAALKWVAENAASIRGDAKCIAVAGDSSGGNQAAVMTLLARDQGGPDIVYQVLIYPVVDYYLPGTQSYEENATGYSLSRDFMIWFWNNYLPPETDPKNPLISPLQASDLSGLPPALIITAEFDPLRDEGEAYAARLRDAGILVNLRRYEGMMHGFVIQHKLLDKGKMGLQEITLSLRSAFKAAHQNGELNHV